MRQPHLQNVSVASCWRSLGCALRLLRLLLRLLLPWLLLHPWCVHPQLLLCSDCPALHLHEHDTPAGQSLGTCVLGAAQLDVQGMERSFIGRRK
jgi:hypothetical protein